MPSGELIAALAALSGLLGIRQQQRWTRRHELARERREAYARYLRAQQALCDIIAALVRSELSYLDLLTQEDAQHASIEVETVRAVWIESGAGEMHASLLAEERVYVAIKKFEEVARKTTTAIRDRQAQPEPARRHKDSQLEQEVLDEWEEQRPVLIDAMRDELRDEILPPWLRWVRRRWRWKRP